MDEYYQILGLPPQASPTQIKRAYRKLALQFHPDVNASHDAQEKFLQITEAYEILAGIRKVRNPFTRYYYRRSEYSAEQQRQTARDRARERARRHAQMQYEDFCRNNEIFRHSWYYRPTQVLVFLVYAFGWLLGIFLILSPALVCSYVYYRGGFWWQGCFCLPLILAGLLVIIQSNRLRKEASPYFQKPQDSH